MKTNQDKTPIPGGARVIPEAIGREYADDIYDYIAGNNFNIGTDFTDENYVKDLHIDRAGFNGLPVIRFNCANSGLSFQLVMMPPESAALYAAAPTLLAVLESMVSMENWAGDDIAPDSTLGRALAAIAQARGA